MGKWRSPTFGHAAPRGFFPIANGGEEATLNAYIFLWLAAAGAGAWSLDAVIQRRRGLSALGRRVASWEPEVRSILRLIVGFLLTLHGLRKLFDVLPSIAGRRNAPPLALDSLPSITGYIELVGGALLMLGLFVRQTALVISLEALLAYALIAQPRTLWPIRNGGIEALLYCVVLAVLRRHGRRCVKRRRSTKLVVSRERETAPRGRFLKKSALLSLFPARGSNQQCARGECLKLSRDRLARQVSGGGSLVKWEHIPKIASRMRSTSIRLKSVLRYGARRGGTSFAQGALKGDYGRDHHGGNFSIWMAGGGVKGGSSTARPTTSATTPRRTASTSTISTPRSCVRSGSITQS